MRIVDHRVIEALYRASQAGVPIDIVDRGICCLRPGVPGISDNIRVRSIVDRFLEHSRIYVFGPDAEAKVFLSSADWMPRNFYRRVEVMFPIEQADLRDRILHEIVPAYLMDNVKARAAAGGRHLRAAPRRKGNRIPRARASARPSPAAPHGCRPIFVWPARAAMETASCDPRTSSLRLTRPSRVRRRRQSVFALSSNACQYACACSARVGAFARRASRSRQPRHFLGPLVRPIEKELALLRLMRGRSPIST